MSSTTQVPVSVALQRCSRDRSFFCRDDFQLAREPAARSPACGKYLEQSMFSTASLSGMPPSSERPGHRFCAIHDWPVFEVYLISTRAPGVCPRSVSEKSW